jgi:uncharacterized protein YdeI (YjbR/CyaY-like superfamily)
MDNRERAGVVAGDVVDVDIEAAKKPETRQRRIDKAIQDLREGRKR